MKRTKIITIVLGIIFISLIAFIGIYVKKQNRMENIIKDYKLGMNLNGSRIIQLDVSNEKNIVIKDTEGNVIEEELTDEQITEKGYVKEETDINSKESLNVENFKKSKKIIEKRLKEFGIEEYLIRINEKTGTIILEIPENITTDYIVSNIGQASKLEIIDTETKEVLMNNSDLKKVSVLYGRVSNETNDVSVFLSFEFSKDGKNKLEEISKKYVKTQDETKNDNTEGEISEGETANPEETAKDKTITMLIDGNQMIQTSFETPITNGILQLTMGGATSNQEKLQENMKSATSVAAVLNNGNLPIEYKINENKYILSNLQEKINIIMIIVAAIAIILIAVLIIKYKKLGFLCGITSIGILAILSLLIKYTNIYLNIETILGVVIILILNFILVTKILEKLKFVQEVKKGITDVFIKFFVRIIPIYIIAIMFSFVKWNPIYNLGLTIFWGVIVMAIYNLIITRTIILINENK